MRINFWIGSVVALIAATAMPALATAQDDTGGTLVADIPAHDTAATYMAGDDSLHLPPIDLYGRAATVAWPYALCSPMGGLWRIHEGMNVSLGAYVTAAFGKNAPTGAGFGQNAALLYAMPISRNLSVAAGGYLNNLSWGGASWREVGLSAILSYRFSEHWEAAVYGNKAVASRYSSPLFRISPVSWPLHNYMGDRIGASLTYNFSPSMSVQLSVERVSMPTPNPTPRPLGSEK